MKTFPIYLSLLLFIGCSKSNSGGGDTPPESLTDTISRVWLEPVSMPGYDTANNYMSYYGFYKTTLLKSYTASNSSGTHRVRYVGSVPLFHRDSVKSRGGEIIEWSIAPALKGKSIFEVYDISSGTLYKTYIASKDSVRILGSFSVWSDLVTPSQKISDAFLYYINVKQNDGIKYRKN